MGAPPNSVRHAECDFWQKSDGLPDHDVYSVAQTSDGFIWAGMIAGSSGLVRFDGKEFVSPISMAPAAEMQRTRMAAGTSGRLWVTTEAGGGRLTLLEQGKARVIPGAVPRPADRGIPVHEDPAGNLWLGGDGLLVRRPDGAIKDLSPAVRRYGAIRCIASSKGGPIWLATSSGLVRYRDGVFDEPWPVKANLLTVHPARDGSLWLGAIGDPVLFHVEISGAIVGFSQAQCLGAKAVNAICEDSQSVIWIGTYSGLRSLKDGQIGPAEDLDLGAMYIFTLMCDREGSLWIGTADGLYRVRDNPFEYYGPSEGFGSVNALVQGPSGLWACIYGRGVFLYRNHAWEDIGIDAKLDPGNLVETPQGGLWLSLDRQCYRYSGEKVELVPGIQGRMRFRIGSEGVWILTSTNLFLSRDGRTASKVGEWSAREVTSAATNAGGGLLIGSTNGIDIWSGSLRSWLRFSEAFPGRIASSIEWEDSTLWVASDVAIGRFKGGEWRVIRPQAGLAEVGAINTMVVERHNLWLGCDKGLFRIARREAELCLAGAASAVTVVQYDRTQGVRPGRLVPGVWGEGSARDQDGKLWFASKSGAVAVNTAIPLNTEDPPVVVERVRLDREVITLPRAGADIRVPAGTRSIEIAYAALTFVAPQKVKYKYRLVGLDSDWVRVDQSRVAHYAKLAPGGYEFQVAACNSDGVWNEEGARLHLIQEPFFYQTRAFPFLCAILGGLACLGIAAIVASVAHRISTRKMRRRLEIIEAQQALEHERARIARDIHDDLGASLTRIILLTELGRQEPEQTLAPDGHLASIQTTTREIMRRLDEIVWAINPRNDTLDALVTYIGKMASDQARAAGICCRLDFPPNLPAWLLTGSARHHLCLACKEALHNAVKHARPTEVRVSLAVASDSLALEISDNGDGLPVGLDATEGDGLYNLRQRLQTIGGVCRVRSAPGAGTVVTFCLSRERAASPLSTKEATCS
jgi:signal transduction histidine kinase